MAATPPATNNRPDGLLEQWEGRMTARIVFDLDGTLIDSAPDIRAGANGILAEEGAAPLTQEEARSFIGSGAAVFVERMRRARGIPDSEQARLLRTFTDRYEGFVGLTTIYPGVIEALTALRDKGHRLGICTNKPIRPTHAVLAHLALDGYFDTVWGGDSLPQRKPDPAPLLAAFDALGDGPEIYVGDSEVDAETARRSGMPFLLYTQGYRSTPIEDLPVTATFDDFAVLPFLVGGLLTCA